MRVIAGEATLSFNVGDFMAVGEVYPAVFSVIRVYCHVHQSALSLMNHLGRSRNGVEELSVFYHSQRARTLGNECCLWVDEVDCPGDLQVLQPRYRR